MISKIDSAATELDRNAMEIDQEEVEDIDDTSAPTTITYFIHEIYSQPIVVLHHALRALNIPFEGTNYLNSTSLIANIYVMFYYL